MKCEDNCPSAEIKIDQNREVVNCDALEFPWTSKEEGYFLIKLKNEKICCGFVDKNHNMNLELQGKDADKIIKEIAKRKLVNSYEHMGYIASELMRAQDCLENNKEYIQR